MPINNKIKQRNFNSHIEFLKNAPINDTKINDQIISGVIKSNKRIRIKKFDFMKEIVCC